MTINKQDSNSTGLAIAVEASLGTLAGSPVFYEREPNSYSDFGGKVTTLARRPINASRQRKKGVTVDKDANMGWNEDLTQDNLLTGELIDSFLFAARRSKGYEVVTAVDIDAGNPDEYEVASTTGFLVNSLIKGFGFTSALNNALNVVTAITSNTSVEVATGLLATEAGSASKYIRVVGHRGASADLTITNSGVAFPVLGSTLLDFTTLGLIPGEWMWIGGDNSTNKFATAANNGWARIYSIAANAITFDKTDATMVTDNGSGKLIDLYFGTVVKNESDPTLIVRRTIQGQRSLGNDGSGIQSEYVLGGCSDTLKLSVKAQDKVNYDIAFVGTSVEKRTGTTGLKSSGGGGSLVSVVDASAFNCSSHVTRFKMGLLSTTDANPTALFGYILDGDIEINNNEDPNKAVGVVGAFDVTAGIFEVSGSVNAYFTTVAAAQAVDDNADVTIDLALVKENAGIVFDLPLVTLGDGLPKVEADKAILLPLTTDAAASSVFNHTLLVDFFHYLPDLAE